MKYKAMLIVLILFLIGLSACSDKDSGYRYPLKIGNSWTYLSINTEEISKTTTIDTIRIVVDSTLTTPHGVSCYRLRIDETWNGNVYTNYQYLANLNDGLYSLGICGMGFNIKTGAEQIHAFPPFAAGIKNIKDNDDDIWFDCPHLLFPKHPEPGYYWVQPENDDWAEVHYDIHESETVETELGSFKCYVKHSLVLIDPDDPYDNYNYYGTYGLIRFYYEYEDDVDDGFGGEAEHRTYTYEVRLIAADLK